MLADNELGIGVKNARRDHVHGLARVAVRRVPAAFAAERMFRAALYKILPREPHQLIIAGDDIGRRAGARGFPAQRAMADDDLRVHSRNLETYSFAQTASHEHGLN